MPEQSESTWTWIGARCAGCGTVVPLIDTGRELDPTSVLSAEERAEAYGHAANRCPNCGEALRFALIVPSAPPEADGG